MESTGTYSLKNPDISGESVEGVSYAYNNNGVLHLPSLNLAVGYCSVSMGGGVLTDGNVLTQEEFDKAMKSLEGEHMLRQDVLVSKEFSCVVAELNGVLENYNNRWGAGSEKERKGLNEQFNSLKQKILAVQPEYFGYK